MRHIIEVCLDQEVQMQSVLSHRVFRVRNKVGFNSGEQHPRGGPWWRTACAGLVFSVSCFAQDAPAVAPVPPADPSSSHSSASADMKRPADPQATAMHQNDAASTQSQAPANSQRLKQISAETTHLLAMAEALKAEVDKTNKDTLSLNVIREADAIEKLAKTVKARMKQNSGPN